MAIPVCHFHNSGYSPTCIVEDLAAFSATLCDFRAVTARWNAQAPRRQLAKRCRDYPSPRTWTEQWTVRLRCRDFDESVPFYQFQWNVMDSPAMPPLQGSVDLSASGEWLPFLACVHWSFIYYSEISSRVGHAQPAASCWHFVRIGRDMYVPPPILYRALLSRLLMLSALVLHREQGTWSVQGEREPRFRRWRHWDLRRRREKESRNRVVCFIFL